MKTVKITIYDYDELKDKARGKAMNDLIAEWCEMGVDGNPNFDKAVQETERLKTPWFLPEYIFDYCEKELIEELCRYQYYKNGEIYFESED